MPTKGHSNGLMDPRLLKYYSQELLHIREMCGEFALEFPKIAGRLGLESFECADPYVERLLEGFAYMAARVQLKVDAEYPQFAQHLLERIYPDYLAPTPSMGIVHFDPEMAEGSLVEGFVLPRGQVPLRGFLSKGIHTPCQYLTAHDVTLWPIELTEVKYLTSRAAVEHLGLAAPKGTKAAIRFRFRTAGGIPFDKLPMDRLSVYLRGGDHVSMAIYEQLFADALAVVVQGTDRSDAWRDVLPKSCIRRLGFGDDESLLPYSPRSYQGYRLLQEYFAFPERFMFVELVNLQAAISKCAATEIDVVVLLEKSVQLLHDSVDASRFSLFCSPVINLFPKHADRIPLSSGDSEHHVVPDRSRPLDFEVHSITSVHGYGLGTEPVQEFFPFYRRVDDTAPSEEAAYFTVYRTPRVLSTRQRAHGTRSRSYIGSEVFLSIVDAKQAPYSGSIRHLGPKLLCTNRDLPILMPLNADPDKPHLALDISAPVKTARFLSGPTEPQPSSAHRDIAWKLINHLSLNYLSLVNSETGEGATAIRDLLKLYAGSGNAHVRKQIDGVSSVVSRPVHRRVPAPGLITFGRGLEITLTLDETAFDGSGVYLLGAVLEEFFARYASINSFTETVLTTPNRGEIKRWPSRVGRRHVL